MHSELCTDVQIYSNKRFPSFGRPKIIGYMSIDRERQFCSDAHQLKFIKNVCNRKVNFDLNKNYKQAIHRHADHMDQKLDHLLHFLLDQGKKLNFGIVNSIADSRFYCYRGLLTCIACTPYENRETWRIVATLYKGDIYLCARDTSEKIDKRLNMTEKDKRFTSWGYKFEQYVSSESPNSEPNSDVPVDENEEFSLIFSTHLNKHHIIYGAEMDGIWCDSPDMKGPPAKDLGVDAMLNYLSDKRFIELKTNRHIEFPNQQNNFRRFKTKKWWCQSFFASVDSIVCGFRNDDGIVEDLKIFSTRDLVKMSERFWNPSVCLNFLDDFLTYVKRCLAKKIRMLHGEQALNNIHNLPITYLHFEWSPRMTVRVTENYDKDVDPILPQWFLDNVYQYSDPV